MEQFDSSVEESSKVSEQQLRNWEDDEIKEVEMPQNFLAAIKPECGSSL